MPEQAYRQHSQHSSRELRDLIFLFFPLMKKRNSTLIIVEIVLVALIVLFVLNLDRFFPIPEQPAVQASTINISQVITGNRTSKVVVVEFSDFQCPFCAEAAPVVEELRQEYGQRVEFLFKHFALHKNSEKAAEASECARDQGKFWEYHDLLFANQDSLDLDSLKSRASEIGLDRQMFDKCLDSGEKYALVRADYQQAVQLGIPGTPTFFVNDKVIQGVSSATDFEKVIDYELASPNP
jgi:protein-disulfide isomerase